MEQSQNLKLWLPEDTDPLEVSKLSENFEKLDNFAELADPFAVGDILSTLRTDLGEDWLLCNGEPFDTETYPELAGMLPGMGASAKNGSTHTLYMPSGATDTSCYATDGENQLLGFAGSSTMIWSKDNFKTYQTVAAGATLNQYSRLYYLNGMWFLLTHGTSGSYAKNVYLRVFTSPFSAPAKSITLPTAGDGLVPTAALGMDYTNGVYYIFCSCSAFNSSGTPGAPKTVVFLSSDPEFSAVSAHTIWSSGGYAQYFRLNDYFVLLYPGNNVNLNIIWSKSPASGYSNRTVTLTASIGASITSLGWPLCHGGKVYWVDASGGKFKGLAYIDNIESGAVKYVDLTSLAGTGTDVSCSAGGVLDAGGGEFVVFCNGKTFFTTKDLDNPSGWQKFTTNLTQYGFQNERQFVANGYVCACSPGSPNVVAQIPAASVPAISLSGCYTYVKAK